MAFSRLGEYTAPSTPTPPTAPPLDITPLRGALVRAFAVLKDLVALADDPGRTALCEQIDGCLTRVANVEDPAGIGRLAGACLDACQAVVSRLAEFKANERKEMASIIVIIQASVASLSDGGAAFHASVKESTESFESMVRIRDIAELKLKLMAEVRGLKKKTTESQKAWQESLGVLGKRVIALETLLQATQQEAELDPLTNVANRRAFDRACETWLRTGLTRFSVMLIDIDHFKLVNDANGHPTGDRVLVAVALALKSALRSSDLVARMGGDEFAVMAQDVTLRTGENMFERFRHHLVQGLQDAAPPLPRITLSCGVAEYSAGDTVKSLLQRADEALYEAKRLGRNRVATKARPYLRDL